MTIRTADVCDEWGHRVVALPTQWRSFGAIHEFTGAVRTIRCHEDNLILRTMLAEPGEGAVLVVDGGGSLQCELMGGLLAQKALASGWAGVVVHGAVRDQHEIAAIPVGVVALGTNPVKSAKEGVGERDTVITIDGVAIHPGVRVWVDRDGVVVERG